MKHQTTFASGLSVVVNDRNDEPGDGVYYIDDLKAVQIPHLSAK